MQPVLRLAVVMCLGFMGTGWAASEANRFDVARTKVLFYLSNNQTSEALTMFESPANTFTDTSLIAEWQFWHAVALTRAGQLQFALDLFDELKARDFAHLTFAEEYAIALVQVGRYQDAINELDPFKQIPNVSKRLTYTLALAHFELANFSRARQILKRDVSTGLSQPPTGDQRLLSDQMTYLYAAASIQEAQFSEARRALTGLLERQPVSVYSDDADKMLQELNSQTGTAGGLQLGVNVLTAIDSNAQLQNESDGLDGRFALQANAGYAVTEWFEPTYQFFASRHINAQNYDLTSHQIAVNSAFQWFGNPNRARYEFTTHQLDGDFWYRRHLLSLAQTWSSLTVEGQSSFQQYEDEDDVRLQLSLVANPLSVVSGFPLIVDAAIASTLDTDFAMKKLTARSGVRSFKNLNGWLVQGGLSAVFDQFAPDNSTDSTLTFAMQSLVNRNWGTHVTTGAKFDAFAAFSDPDTTNYQRWVTSINLGWRY